MPKPSERMRLLRIENMLKDRVDLHHQILMLKHIKRKHDPEIDEDIAECSAMIRRIDAHLRKVGHIIN